jgi:hypothetical protein
MMYPITALATSTKAMVANKTPITIPAIAASSMPSSAYMKEYLIVSGQKWKRERERERERGGGSNYLV